MHSSLRRVLHAGRFFRLSVCLLVLLAGIRPLHAQAVEHVSLDGAWQFRQTGHDPRADKFAGNHPEVSDWHAATIPGVVQTDLLANKLIPAPFYRDNEGKLQWIGFTNWEYRRSFSISTAQMRRQHAELVFYGLDTFAKVFVNEHPVLTADNMFRTWRVDVRPYLHAGENTIRVAFTSPQTAVLTQVLAEKYPVPGNVASPWSKPFGVSTSNYVRKAPYNYGWDWGPRFITSGIWQPVEIEFWDAARIDNMYVRQLDVSSASANLSVEADIVAAGPARVRIALSDGRWFPPAADFAEWKPAKNHPEQRSAAVGPALVRMVWLHAGENHIVFPLNLQRPALWYPVGYGAQNMYRFRVTLHDGAAAVDRREVHTGLRAVTLLRNKDQWGQNFAFEVNGIPIFAKGANLIPFDSFPNRVPDADMQHILDSAVEAHMNMLRVWGGGVYGTDRFYELADERGLMLWQEFMFSDALYPTDKAFMDNARQEAIDQVRRLRNHPSIVLWCGNNEIESGWSTFGNMKRYRAGLPPEVRDTVWGGYMNLFSGILPRVVAQYSPATPYWPSSPSNDFTANEGNDQYGDAHYWGVWHGRKPFSSFEQQYPRFLSEYGFQSFPSMPTIDTFTEPGDRTLLSPVMLAHQKNTEGNQLIKLYTSWEFPQPKDFPSFVYVSQVLQAEGIKLSAEHLRRNRPHVMGSLYWQLNDCWPVASWSSVDYYGRWKALQYYARRFYQDELVSPHVRDGQVEVSVISDRTAPLKGTVRIELMNFTGKVLAQQDVPVTIQPLSAAQVWANAENTYLQGAKANEVFLHTELRSAGENGGNPISTNNLYFLPYKDLHLPPATLPTSWTTVNGVPAVEVRSATLARDVYMEPGDLKTQPSDNFFDLLPGETRTITFPGVSADELHKKLHVMSLTDAFAGTAETATALNPSGR